jgi:hypothetical protein
VVPDEVRAYRVGMAKVTYLLDEESAHELTAALQARDYGTVMPPALPGEDGRRVVVTVPDGDEEQLQGVVDDVAPDARRT